MKSIIKMLKKRGTCGIQEAGLKRGYIKFKRFGYTLLFTMLLVGTMLGFRAVGVKAAGEATPPMPKGATYVKGTIQTGYVIQDTDGNQWVWVPAGDPSQVPNGYQRQEIVNGQSVNKPDNDSNQAGLSIDKTRDPDEDKIFWADWYKMGLSKVPSNYSGNPELFQKSIVDYEISKSGGFYVARYQAGGNKMHPYSKAGLAPIADCEWRSACNLANAMDSRNGPLVMTHLMYDTEWDTICQWLGKNGYNLLDSKDYGYYVHKNFVPAVTGSTKETLGIFDIAGNVKHWTMGTYVENIQGSLINSRVVRGGGFYDEPATKPVAFRGAAISNNNCDIGFRPCMVVLTDGVASNMRVSPTSASVTKGCTYQLDVRAEMTYGDTILHNINITELCSFNSSNDNRATVSASGLITGVTENSSTDVKITCQGQSLEIPVTIVPVVDQRLVSTPDQLTIDEHATQQMNIKSHRSDGSEVDITSLCKYISKDTNTATVSKTGLVTPASIGQTSITVSYSNITLEVPVTIKTAQLTSLTVTPKESYVPIGGSLQLVATAYFSDGSSRYVSSECEYKVDDTSVATVNGTGVVKALKMGGSTGIWVKYKGMEKYIRVLADGVTISSTQSNVEFYRNGLTQQQSIFATLFSTGSFSYVTSDCEFISSNLSVATVSDSGLITSVGPGTATVTASYMGKTCTVNVTVGAVITGVTITPNSSIVLEVNGTQQMKVIASYNNGTTADITNDGVNSSVSIPKIGDKKDIASVTSKGLITGLSPGSANVYVVYYTNAQAEMHEVIIPLKVNGELQAITVSPNPIILKKNEAKQLTVNAQLSDNTKPDISADANCKFTTANTSIAKVSEKGLITGVKPGTTTMTATYKGKTVQIPVAVNFDEITFDQGKDVDITVHLDSGTGIPMKAIRNGSTALSLGTDYTAVDANNFVISKSYLAALGVGITTLTFDLNTGNSVTLKITVSDSNKENSSISPVAALFDKYEGASQNNEISVTLTLNGNTLTDIKNGAYTLIKGTEYTIEDNVVTFTKDYLMRCSSDTYLFFVFSGGKTTNTSVLKIGVVSNVKALNDPQAIAIDSFGNIYVSDLIDSYFGEYNGLTNNHRIIEIPKNTGRQWGIDMLAGETYLVAGGGKRQENSPDGGKALTTSLYKPNSIALDKAGNLYMVDSSNRVRMVPVKDGLQWGMDMQAGNIYTIAANLNPYSIALDGQGNIYLSNGASVLEIPVADVNQWGIEMKAGTAYTIAGTGTAGYSGDSDLATKATLNSKCNITLDEAGNLYISDGIAQVIREIPAKAGNQWGIEMQAGFIYTIAGNGTKGYSGDGGKATDAKLSSPSDITTDATGNLYFVDSNEVVRMLPVKDGTPWGPNMKTGYIYTITNGLNNVSGIAVDAEGKLLIPEYSGTDGASVKTIPISTIGDVGLSTVFGQSVKVDGTGIKFTPALINLTVDESITKVMADDIVAVDKGATVTFYGTDRYFDNPTGNVAIVDAGIKVYFTVTSQGSIGYYAMTIKWAGNTGTITGKVQDNSGSPEVYVKVSVTVYGKEYTAKTNSRGTYTITKVPVGKNYTVTVEETEVSGNTATADVVLGEITDKVDFTLVKTNKSEARVDTVFGQKVNITSWTEAPVDIYLMVDNAKTVITPADIVPIHSTSSVALFDYYYNPMSSVAISGQTTTLRFQIIAANGYKMPYILHVGKNATTLDAKLIFNQMPTFAGTGCGFKMFPVNYNTIIVENSVDKVTKGDIIPEKSYTSIWLYDDAFANIVNSVSLTPGETTRINFWVGGVWCTVDVYRKALMGIITGTVKNYKGNPEEGAKVSVTVNSTTYSATTIANGTYSIEKVPVGAGYTITAAKTGYNSGSTTADVTVNATTSSVDITITAIPVTHTVAVAASPALGGIVSGGGTHSEGASATVTATPSAGYSFVNWTEDGKEVSTDVSYSFTLGTVNRTLTANFSLIPPATHTVAVAASPALGGTVSGVGTYSEGASVTVTATPNSGYSFVNWTEGSTEVSIDASYSFTLGTVNRTLTANFSLLPPATHTVAVAASPALGGTVSGGGTYSEGASVTVTATPNSGYKFVNWTEGSTEVSTDASYSFTLGTVNRTLTANFSLIPPVTHTVAVAASPALGGTVSGGGTHSEGASVTVTATPSAGYSFVNWTEGSTEVSTNASYSFTLGTVNRTLTANFSLIPPVTHTVAVAASPALGGTVSGGGTHSEGASVTVTATPSAGYSFVNWTEGSIEVSTDASYSFTLGTVNRTLTANFSLLPPATHTVAVTASPALGGIISGGGTYSEGASVTVTATPNNGYKFVNWTEGSTEVSTDASYSFTLGTVNRTLTANFSLLPPATHTVAVAASPALGGTVSGGGTYSEGASVTVTATPNSGYKFVNWTEGSTEVSTDASYSFTLGTMNRTLTANFSLLPPATHTVAVTASPALGGTVSGGGTYSEGASVTVTATPNNGYKFVNWTEGSTEVSTDASYSFTLGTVNRTLTANFSLIPPVTHTVAVAASPALGGTVSGGGTHSEGASVTVTATPNSGYKFVNWTEGSTEVSTDASYSFTLGTVNRTLKANFSLIPPATHTVAVAASPALGGTVSGGDTYSEGASVTVTATPNSGYKFVNWTEGSTEVSTDASYSFTLGTVNRTLKANFSLLPPVINTGIITGTVKDSSSKPLAGAKVSLTVSNSTYSAITLADGTYSIGNVPAGATYTVTAAKTDYNSGSATASVLANATTSNIDITITAIHVSPATHTVTFADWNGTIIKTQTINNGEGATAPSNPTREGYIFTGWDKIFSNVTGNLTVIAKYTVVSPTVTDAEKVAADKAALSIGYAVGDSADVVTQNLRLPVTGSVYGSTITWESNNVAVISNSGVVTRPAYASGDVNVTVSAIVYNNGESETKDFSLKVLKLAPITHTVTFKDRDGTVLKTETVNEGSGATAPSNPSRAGYTFIGWDTAFSNVTSNLTITAQYSSNGSGSNVSSNGGTGTPDNTTQKYKAIVSGIGTTATSLEINVDINKGSAVVDIGAQRNIMTDGKHTVITMPSIPKVTDYTLGIPVEYLSKSDGTGTLTFNSDVGNMIIQTNMLTGTAGEEGKKAQITMGKGDKTSLTETEKAVIGDRPLIQLGVTIDGKQVEWNNPNAPVTISIPYAPTTSELINPENIVVWYIDGSGKAVSMPNGHYDAATGTVTFNTTHFSAYAVGFNKVDFNDVTADKWYSKAVNFIAAREIASGTGNVSYRPNAKLTRGEFIVMLMKAYGITPDATSRDNFSDAGNTYYAEYLSKAKEIGISDGIGNNMFVPGKEITRQEMFTLLYKALNVINQMPKGNSGKQLTEFKDSEQIASWAKDAMTLMVETGTIAGDSGKLSPTGTTTRAEMAQVLYNLLSK